MLELDQTAIIVFPRLSDPPQRAISLLGDSTEKILRRKLIRLLELPALSSLSIVFLAGECFFFSLSFPSFSPKETRTFPFFPPLKFSLRRAHTGSEPRQWLAAPAAFSLLAPHHDEQGLSRSAWQIPPRVPQPCLVASDMVAALCKCDTQVIPSWGTPSVPRFTVDTPTTVHTTLAPTTVRLSVAS